MTIYTRDSIPLELESMIDQLDLPTVLNALAEVCHEKADHLEETWLAPKDAAIWRTAARKLFRVKQWGEERMRYVMRSTGKGSQNDWGH